MLCNICERDFKYNIQHRRNIKDFLSPDVTVNLLTAHMLNIIL